MAFRSFAILSVPLLAVLAQASSDSLIPTGISTQCAAYLTVLDNDVDMAACTSQLTTALQQYAPSASTATPSSSAINSTLSTLCSNTFSACSQSTVTTQLSSFYAACASELTSAPNQVVKGVYDVLYVFKPFLQAICATDNNGNYCAAEISSWIAPAGIQSQLQAVLTQHLYISSPTSNSTFTPNVTTYDGTNLVFLFTQPSASSSVLCTSCTRNILAPFITFESASPYGPGQNNSLILSGQSELYNNVTGVCGSNFLSGAVEAAGGISASLLSGAAPRVGGHELSAAVGAILGVAALLAASL